MNITISAQKQRCIAKKRRCRADSLFWEQCNGGFVALQR
ncbi:uncharacterized protein G2W53_041257 [Senna tora]|uniref:Uncharacterized protein n=1 Tax=Senna tora TaxID=362788 RepID=A0A834W168_9FABA|nr:uncharacterized protein G2W53_041257 [Senna tora]